MSNALIAIGEIDKIIASIAPSEEAIKIRDRVLEPAAKVVQVTNAEELDRATLVGGTLQGFLTTVDAERKKAKSPADKIGEAIDQVASQLSADAALHKARIGRLVAKYHADQQAKIAEERARLRAEQQALEDARQKLAKEKAELAAREEAARKAADPVELEKIEDAKLEAEFEAANIAERQEIATRTVIEDEPLKGGAVRGDFDIEVEDEKAFYEKFPQFCTIAVKKKELKAWAKLEWDGKSPTPGVKITPKHTTAFRGINPALTLK